MFSGMREHARAELTEMEGRVAIELVIEIMRGMPDYPARGIRGDLERWCSLLLQRLRDAKVRIAYGATITRLPPPKEPYRPSYVIEAGSADRVSTPELRRRAFGAYAQGMAFGDENDAFEAAVIETLRLTRNWSRKVASMHTIKFVVPAYQRAFPPKAPPYPE